MSRKVAYCVLVAAVFLSVAGGASAMPSGGSFPRYDHVFLMIEENHNFNQIIGNRAAPIINALAAAGFHGQRFPSPDLTRGFCSRTIPGQFDGESRTRRDGNPSASERQLGLGQIAQRSFRNTGPP